MFDSLLLLNKLGSVDVGFFVACAVIIVLIVAIYFLIPVFNKKQYQEQRDNLKKREEAFRSNQSARFASQDANISSDVEPTADESTEQIENPTTVDTAEVDNTEVDTAAVDATTEKTDGEIDQQ